MLLLSCDQVQYCQVIRREKTGTEQIIPGIVYYGKLFIRGEVFPLSQKKRAIEYSRQQFSYYQEKIYILLVRERDYFALWYENCDVRKLPTVNNEPFPDFVATIDLKQVVFHMRQSLPQKTIRKGFRRFHNCFSTQDVINWLQTHLNLTHREAMKLGQRLVDHHWLLPLNSYPVRFHKRNHFYQFND